MTSPANFKITNVSLVVTNLFLMVMALVMCWKTYDQIMVFWSENLVIGFYTLIKIPFCREINPEMADHLPVSPKFGAWAMVPFFLIVFLIFCALHLAMIHMLFAPEVEQYAETHQQNLFPDINWFPVIIAIIALGINHGISLGINFFGGKEYLHVRMNEMLIIPYKRVVFVHLVVLGFGLVLHVIGNDSAILVCLFFLVKIIIDYRRHKAEHSLNSDSMFKWI